MAFQQVVNAFNLTPGTVVRSERHVLLELANLADGREGVTKDTLFYGIDTLAIITGYDEKTVRTAISALVKKGFVIRKRRFGTSNLYKVTVPKTKREKIKREKKARANF